MCFQTIHKRSRMIMTIWVSMVISACTQSVHPTIQVMSGSTMGTTYSVQVAGMGNEKSLNKLGEQIRSILQIINQAMSTWDRNSELSKFNYGPVNTWTHFSDITMEVLKLSLDINQLTNGSFDVTVGSVVNLWGFGPSQQSEAVPRDSEISKAMQRTGVHHIVIDPDTRHVKKEVDLYIDFSAIAKGYAVDKISDYLEQEGINDYLVEVGGEVRGKGNKPGGKAWKIAIEAPQVGGRQVQQVVSLTNTAVATSGDYRNYFEKDGHRYSHMIDTGTGRPVKHKLASVTVVDKHAARADALATALMVMGPSKARNFAEENDIAAFFIVRQDDGFMQYTSSSFAQYEK